MSLRVKICGITRVSDACAAVEAGADALGFMFYEPSPRNLAPEAAAAIIRELPPFIARVGVFVNAEADTVKRIAETCGLDTLQLHGEETPEYCAQFSGYRVVKAFRVRDESSLFALRSYSVSAWLLDSYVADQHGGTGAKFNWDLAITAKSYGCPVILAGGLTPENVAEAVRQVRPYALDVSSGVESAPGVKDHAKVAAFIRAAKSVV